MDSSRRRAQFGSSDPLKSDGAPEQTMSSSGMSLIAFVFIFGGAIVGMILRRALPDHHVRDDSRDVIKLPTGLVGTMTALLLGLLLASANAFHHAPPPA